MVFNNRSTDAIVTMHRRSLILEKGGTQKFWIPSVARIEWEPPHTILAYSRPVLLSWKCPKTAFPVFSSPTGVCQSFGAAPILSCQKGSSEKILKLLGFFYPWWLWREGRREVKGGKWFYNNVKKTALLVADGFPHGHQTIKNIFLKFF